MAVIITTIMTHPRVLQTPPIYITTGLLSPSLISLTVSVDVKHHVYLLLSSTPKTGRRVVDM